jgi:amino acid adenylation domain-containing protein
LIDGAAERYRLDRQDRVLMLSSIAFDSAAEELWPALAAGAAVVPWSGGDPAPVHELLEFIDRTGVTVASLSTSWWHTWVGGLSDSPEPLPRSLRLVIVGGQEVSAEHLRCWQNAYPNGPEWLHTYGVTEATVTSIIDDAATSAVDGTRVAVGRPLDGVTAHVLDSRLMPVESGEVGELYIGGPGVARGYLDRPTLTADRFVPDPFATAAGARLYRTGDRARMLADGRLELLGRADRQVKVHGHRLELGEVEAALLAHPSIVDAAVALSGGSDPHLRAYVVMDEPLDDEELRSFLGDRLPSYMLPSAFVPLDDLADAV